MPRMQLEDSERDDNKAGARRREATNLSHGPTLAFFTVRENDAGTSWRGEVEIQGQVILTTASSPNDAQALAAAEKLLIQRFVEVLGSGQDS